jgi:hypothetical protein
VTGKALKNMLKITEPGCSLIATLKHLGPGGKRGDKMRSAIVYTMLSAVLFSGCATQTHMPTDRYLQYGTSDELAKEASRPGMPATAVGPPVYAQITWPNDEVCDAVIDMLKSENIWDSGMACKPSSVADALPYSAELENTNYGFSLELETVLLKECREMVEKTKKWPDAELVTNCHRK